MYRPTAHTWQTYHAITHNLFFLSFTLGILLTSSVVSAEIYRWVDAQGKIHFSDHPPEEQLGSEEISSKLSPLNRDSSSTETKKLRQVFQQETPEEVALQQQQKIQQQNQDQKKQSICQKARNRLASIQGPVYFFDDDGKQMMVSESEREQRAQKLQQEIHHLCHEL